jgi:hypothetical protein
MIDKYKDTKCGLDNNNNNGIPKIELHITDLQSQLKHAVSIGDVDGIWSKIARYKKDLANMTNRQNNQLICYVNQVGWIPITLSSTYAYDKNELMRDYIRRMRMDTDIIRHHKCRGCNAVISCMKQTDLINLTCATCSIAEKSNISDHAIKKSPNTYKRGVYSKSKHFMNKISRVICVVEPNIPNAVIDQIKWKLGNRRPTITVIRSILKSIRQTSIYDDIYYIRCKILKVKPIRIDKKHMEMISEWFDEVNAAWELIKRESGRKSSISYLYQIRKYIEWLHLYGYADYTPLIPNIRTTKRKNLDEIDMYWMKICSNIGKKYIETY